MATATSTDTRLFASDGGEVICEKHAGHYLSSLLESSTKRRKHFPTPLGTWHDYTAELRAEGFECESCMSERFKAARAARG